MLVWACKKEPPYNADEHVTYTHWYELRSTDSLDSLFWLSDTLFSVYIPNAFTPNGDGCNDYFEPTGQFYDFKNMKILNKYNNRIYYQTNSYPGWDGRQAYGAYCPLGVYVYKLVVADTFGEEHEYTGCVSLYR